MDKSISVVTYMSSDEGFNDSLVRLADVLAVSGYDVEVIVFSEKQLSLCPKDFVNIVSPGATKFSRIRTSFGIARSQRILSIDNDICPNTAEIIRFIEDAGSSDLAWGRIAAVAKPGLMSQIIAVDKRISHNLIRPALWSLGVGISIPGQVFLINRDVFGKILPSLDTRFDDLTIGLYSRKYGCSVFRSHLLLGEERPSSSLRELVIQRARWGRGFAEVCILGRNEKMARYVVAHGIAYHFLWCPVLFLFCWLCTVDIVWGVLLVLGLVIASCGSRFDFIVPWLLYCLLSPLVHAVWFISVLKELRRSLK